MGKDCLEDLVPTKTPEVTLEWLNESLKRHGLPRIESFRIQPIDAGFYGSIAKIEVTYVDDEAGEGGPGGTAPTAFAVKFPPEDLVKRNSLAESLGLYEREYNFYTQLGDQVPIPVPKCYAACYEHSNQNSVLLLEWVEGEVSDEIEGATYEQAKRAFESAAQLHRRFYSDPILEEEWIKPFGGPPVIDGLVAAQRAMVPVGLARIRDWCPDWMAKHAENSHEIIHQQLTELNRLPHCLIHLDFRLPNMIFGANDSMVLVDWHSPLRAPGLLDLVFFLAMSTKSEDRREWEEELVGGYLDAVHGWSANTWPDWFRTGWCRFALVSAFNCLRNAAVLDIENDPVARDSMKVWIERSDSLVRDHDALALL